MPVKTKSRVTQPRSRKKNKSRPAPKQDASGRSSTRPPQSRPASDWSAYSANQADLWVAEKTSLSRQQDVVAWTPHTVKPSDARLLELADIALGLRKPEPFRRRKSAFLSKNRSSSSHS